MAPITVSGGLVAVSGLPLRASFGSGPKVLASPVLGSPLLWDRASGVIMFVGVLLSLLMILFVLFGLRRATARALQRAQMGQPSR